MGKKSDRLSIRIFKGVGTHTDPVIVTDNAANMVRVVELLSFLHIGCFAQH